MKSLRQIDHLKISVLEQDVSGAYIAREVIEM